MTAASLQATATKLAALPGATITTFLKGLAVADAEGAEVAVVKPKVPALTQEHRDALASLASQIEGAQFPEGRRSLTDDERKQLGELLRTVSAISGLVDKLKKDALRVALFNDLDIQAESDGKVTRDTPRDASGFYLVPGEGPGFAREYRSGTPSADADVLAELVVEGALEKKDYLKITKPVRVIDETEFLRFVGRKPQLLGVLRRAVRYTRAASVSLKVK